MRFTLLFTASVLAASIGLSACSGGSQAIPGGSQAASSMGRHAGLHFVAVTPDTTPCPTQFFLCTSVSKSTPASLGICISSTGSCSTPAPGVWTWSGNTTVVKSGKPFKKIGGSYSPNPGNPITLTLTEKKKVKKSHGKYKYAWNLEACNSSSGCVTGAIGIATQ